MATYYVVHYKEAHNKEQLYAYSEHIASADACYFECIKARPKATSVYLKEITTKTLRKINKKST